MADEEKDSALAGAARVVGSTLGKVVSKVSGGGEGKTASPPPPPAPPAKENLWTAEYAGSGTFIIHKPKRKAGKRHRTIVRNRRPGMR